MRASLGLAAIVALMVVISPRAAAQEGQVISAGGEALTVPCPTEAESLAGRDLRLPFGCRQLDPSGRAALSLDRYKKLRGDEARAEDLAKHEQGLVLRYERMVAEAQQGLVRCDERLRVCSLLVKHPPAPPGAPGPLMDAPGWVWVVGGVAAVVVPWFAGRAAGLSDGQAWATSGGVAGALAIGAYFGGDQ